MTYLTQYFVVDNVDHMIILAMIHFISWKYSHSPFCNDLLIAVVAAYDMYQECAIRVTSRSFGSSLRKIGWPSMPFASSCWSRCLGITQAGVAIQPTGLTEENFKRTKIDRLCKGLSKFVLHLEAVERQGSCA
ncbi:hypothetical protein ACHAWF_004988 [Thalassiosira exigua]